MTTEHDIIRIERLARLDLPETAVEAFSHRLSKVFAWIDQLKTVDVTGVDPLPNPAVAFIQSTPLREDCPHPTPSVETILENAPEKEFDFFTVPKMVE